MKEKSIHKRYVDKEISLKEYLNWWAQQKGFKDLVEYRVYYRQTHKKQIAESGKQYRENNKEQISEKRKQYYLKNKERIILHVTEYYHNHKEQVFECRKLYRKNNSIKISEQKKIYRQSHKEQINEQKNRWYEKQYGGESKYRKHMYPLYKERRDRYIKKYRKTVGYKISSNKCHAKRKRCLGYNVLNIKYVNNSKYEGHHLDKENVLFIPTEIHKSIYHNIHRGKNMEIINEKAIIWYIQDVLGGLKNMITQEEFENFKRFYVYLKPLVIEKLKEKSIIEFGKEYPQKKENIVNFEYIIEDNIFSIETDLNENYSCRDKEYYSLSPEFLYDNNAMSNFKEEIAKKKQKEQLEKDIKEQNEHQKIMQTEMTKLQELAKKYNFDLDPKE